MAHFAQLNDDNIVTQVIVVSNNECKDTEGNESEAVGVAFCESLLGGRWTQTSYNAATNGFRKQYPGVNFSYDQIADVFIAPKPFASWSLDENYDWQAPVERPAVGKQYSWDESNQVWVESPVI